MIDSQKKKIMVVLEKFLEGIAVSVKSGGVIVSLISLMYQY